MSASIFFLIVALCICTLVIIQVRNLKMKKNTRPCGWVSVPPLLCWEYSPDCWTVLPNLWV